MIFKLMPFKPWLVILITVIATLALLAGWIHSRPNRHSVIILNRSSNDVVITKICIDDDCIAPSDKVVMPIGPMESRHASGKYLRYSFKSGPSTVLSVDVRHSTGKNEKLNCKLIDQHAMGCVFYTSIKNTGKLTCVCDSNSDFYD